MPQKPCFSIITVSHNSEATIERAIESVLNQTYNNVEYIIIDGNSDDRTDELIRQYANRLSIYISEPDDGIFFAMNKGIKQASGDFIYFLNSDDFFVDNRVLHDVASFIEGVPSCEIIYGNIEARDGKGNHWLLASPPPEEILKTLVSGAMHHQATFASKHTFTKVGFFQETFNSVGDYEWWLRVAAEATIQKQHFNRTIASYFIGGKSSNIEAALNEMFEVQNCAEIYQSDYWLHKRIEIYQEILKSPKGHWGLYRQQNSSSQTINDLNFLSRGKQKLLRFKQESKYMLDKIFRAMN